MERASPTPVDQLTPSIESKLAALRLTSGSLLNKVMDLVDAVNGLDIDCTSGTPPSPVKQQQRLAYVAQIHATECEVNGTQDAVTALEAELQAHWAAYAAYQCRALCDGVRERLPRELQLLVVEALWAGQPHRITEWNTLALETEPADAQALVESWGGRDTGHLFEARFVGEELLGDIRAAWWRMAVFEMQMFSLVPKLLRQGFWGEAVKRKVRRVVMVCVYYRERRRRWGPRLQLKGEIKTSKAGAKLDEELRYLSELAPGTAITLAIKKRNSPLPEPVEADEVFFRAAQRHALFTRAVSRLFPGLERLQKDGFTITVVMDKEDIKVQLGQSVEEWVDADRRGYPGGLYPWESGA